MNPTEIIPGVIFYSFFSAQRKEKVGFFEHSTLVLQVSGQFTLETASQKISMKGVLLTFIHPRRPLVFRLFASFDFRGELSGAFFDLSVQQRDPDQGAKDNK